ncbi:hypothetical protein HYW60_00970 [Candidatus Kaiserbacteria bacterium]|nr:hypothetical protein [Candidatus Kaiserbacteria bacterium]
MSYRVSNNIRVLLSALGFVGAIALPPWVPLLVMAMLSLRFAAWEVIAIGFLVDMIWFSPAGGIVASLPIFTLLGLMLAWGLEPLRSEFLTR